jgi:superfamily I DNA/RNA helicase
MGSAEELQRALQYPWDKWIVFLHPDQRALAEGRFKGPIKVCGSAGTGKTVVALHRAAHLARANPDSRLLLTTLSDPLANALQIKLNCLVAHEPRLAERIDVRSLDSQAKRLFRLHGGEMAQGAKLAHKEKITELLETEAVALGLKGYSKTFLYAEWRELVDARQLTSWEEYRTTPPPWPQDPPFRAASARTLDALCSPQQHPDRKQTLYRIGLVYQPCFRLG